MKTLRSFVLNLPRRRLPYCRRINFLLISAIILIAVSHISIVAQEQSRIKTESLENVLVGDISNVPAPNISAKAWIVVDASSNQALAAFNPDVRIEPASLTKIMSAYVVFHALKENHITLEQQVVITENAWRTEGSRMFIEPRKLVTVHELIQGMIVQSGNDASVALAETVGINEDIFVSLMNKQAQNLNLRNTNFVNATGLPDPQHFTTARDLATLGIRLIKDFPDFGHYHKQKEYTYNRITQPNRNRLLWIDPSVDGLKTGYTELAGYCQVSSASRGNRRIIAVVLGTDSEASRVEESLKLLNWGFQNFDTVKLFDKNQTTLEARVWEGTKNTVRLGPPEPVWLSVPRGKANQIKPVVQYPGSLLAPLKNGQQVGNIQFLLESKVLHTEPLVVQDDVSRVAFWGRAIDFLKRWL